MAYEFIDSEGEVVGCGTAEELTEYLANGWLPEGVVLGKALV